MDLHLPHSSTRRLKEQTGERWCYSIGSAEASSKQWEGYRLTGSAVIESMTRHGRQCKRNPTQQSRAVVEQNLALGGVVDFAASAPAAEFVVILRHGSSLAGQLTGLHSPYGFPRTQLGHVSPAALAP